MLDQLVHSIRKKVWVDATLDFEFSGHFQGHKGQNSIIIFSCQINI